MLPLDSKSDKLPHYIAIEGLFGSGKLEFAERLSSYLNGHFISENTHQNPFLESFFKHSQPQALAGHLYFLANRFSLEEKLHQERDTNTIQITDFLFEKDRFLAESLLPKDEFSIYDEIYKKTMPEFPKPDYVIYLQLPTASLEERLASEKSQRIKSINPFFLETVNDSYRQFFHYYDDAPLLIINAESLDFLENMQFFTEIIDHLCNTKNGRSFFNLNVKR